MLVEKLPVFMQSGDLEVQERVRHSHTVEGLRSSHDTTNPSVGASREGRDSKRRGLALVIRSVSNTANSISSVKKVVS